MVSWEGNGMGGGGIGAGVGEDWVDIVLVRRA